MKEIFKNLVQFKLKTVEFILVNGEMGIDGGEANKFGETDLFMKGIGGITRHKEKEDLYIMTETFMKDYGLMIRPMELALILIIMDLNILEIGLKTKNTELEKKC